MYLTAKAIAHWVEETFAVSYTESGMTALLHRLGYVYKKPKLIPGKADPKAQEAFLSEYAQVKRDKVKDDPVYFMDAVHRQHNPVIAYGWIKRGEERKVRSNTGRRRLNINGAIDLQRLAPVVRFDDTINTDSTIALFEQLEQLTLTATWIYVICDNARYYRSKAVKEYLQTSRIKRVFPAARQGSAKHEVGSPRKACRCVRVVGVAKGPKVPVASGGRMQSASDTPSSHLREPCEAPGAERGGRRTAEAQRKPVAIVRVPAAAGCTRRGISWVYLQMQK